MFDQMVLDGVLMNNYFICIAAKTDQNTPGSLGDVFLEQKYGADNYQLLMILDPKAQRASEIEK